MAGDQGLLQEAHLLVEHRPLLWLLSSGGETMLAQNMLANKAKYRPLLLKSDDLPTAGEQADHLQTLGEENLVDLSDRPGTHEVNLAAEPRELLHRHSKV